MSNMFGMVIGTPEDYEAARKADGSDGQDIPEEILNNPLVKDQLKEYHPTVGRSVRKRDKQIVDHVHLSRYNDTDLYQWTARHSDGWHRPFGSVMKRVEG